MKNLLKLFFLIFILVITIFSINLIRNYFILNKIHKLNFETYKNLNNFYYTDTLTYSYSTGNFQNAKTEIYYKDEIILLKTYDSDKLTQTIWKNTNTNELIKLHENGTNSNENLDISLENYINNIFPLLNKNLIFEIIKNNPFMFIKSKNDYYIINDSQNKQELYILSYSGILDKLYIQNENTSFEYLINFEENIVTDKDIEKPIINK